MEEITQNLELKEKKTIRLNCISKWSVNIASLVFSFSAYMMLHLYGIVHWQIMLDGGVPIEGRPRDYALMLLGILMCLRLIFVALAVIYAGLSYAKGPGLGSVIASIFAGLAVLIIFIMM